MKPYWVGHGKQPRNLESDPKAAAKHSKALQRQGYDGVIHEIDLSFFNDGKFNEYVVYKQEQILIVTDDRSALPNRRRR